MRLLVPMVLLAATFCGALQTQSVNFTEYPIRTPGANPFKITAGPDGALWFTEQGTAKIGPITEYPVQPVTSFLTGITVGPDGTLWFGDGSTGSSIRRITTSGSISALQGPSAGVNSITTGPDGALWFTEYSALVIGRITTSMAMTEYPVPNPPTPNSYPYLFGITTGPDGALWFTDSFHTAIGRITTSGAITEYPVPTALPYASTLI